MHRCELDAASGQRSRLAAVAAEQRALQGVLAQQAEACHHGVLAELWRRTRSVAPPEVWAALAGFLLSTLLHRLAHWHQARPARR